MTKKIKAILKDRRFEAFIFLLIFGFSFLLVQKFSQSFHFVDEEDHFVFAYYMNQGYRLYTDLSSNHQPVVYFLSALVQRLAAPDNLFLLLKRSREAVFGFGLIWSLLLWRRFGKKFLLTALILETTKYFIFGSHLLAESLAVYPLLYILGLTLETAFFKKEPDFIDAFLFGLANFFIFFNLLPLLPSVLVLDLYFLLKGKHIKAVGLGFVAPAMLLFLFISPFTWFKETVYNNWRYAIPQITFIKHKADYLRFFVFPFLFFFLKDGFVFFNFIRLLAAAFLINLLFFLKIKNRRLLIKWLALFFLIMFLNNRLLNPAEANFYSGFHLVPWYGAFIFFNFFSFKLIFFKIKTEVKYLTPIFFFLAAIFLFSSRQMPYFLPIDKDTEHNVNFYPYYLTSRAIKSVADKDDRLMVIPDESIIYWQTGVNPATRQIVYYEWEYWVPELKLDFDKALLNNPPEFIYADFKRIGPASYLELLKLSLEKDYFQAVRINVPQNLYLKKDKIKAITDKQWQDWEELSFDKIY